MLKITLFVLCQYLHSSGSSLLLLACTKTKSKINTALERYNAQPLRKCTKYFHFLIMGTKWKADSNELEEALLNPSTNEKE